MSKLYTSDQVVKRIDDIHTNEDAMHLSVKEALKDPRFKNATIIGILMMMTQ